MSEFQRVLAQTLRDAVRSPDSPLFNLSTDHKLDELLAHARRPVSAPPHRVTDVDIDAALARFAELPLDRVPDVAPLPTGSHMPYTANPLFTGREDDLLALARLVKGGDDPAGSQTVAIQAAVTGMGGVGKTQLAAAFAHRYGHFFHAVHWISLADPAAVRAEIATCGNHMAELPTVYGSLPLDEQVRLVLQQWQGPLPRLLIFDNCEAPDLLAQWRPTTGGSRLLVTSRRRQWPAGMGVRAHSLETLPRRQSLSLLHKFPATAEPAWAFAADDAPTLDAIADAIGDLPLALHMAGSYLATYRFDVSPADYLHALRTQPLDHPSLTAGDFSPTEHDLHVGRTFLVSYERLDPDDATPQNVDGPALWLLHASAHFAPGEPIPRDLLRQTVSDQRADKPPSPAAREGTRVGVGVGVQRLVNLGLLEQEADGALRLHRLLARFVLENDDELGMTTRHAVRQTLADEAGKINDSGDPRPLLPWQVHLHHVVDEAGEELDEQAALLCNQLGSHLQITGDLVRARPYLKCALAIHEEVLGPTHPDTARSLNNLGGLLQAMGELAGARPYYERALAIDEVVSGPAHPETAHSLNNLGVLLQVMGDLAGAHPYLERALAIHEGVLGPDHPDTARSLNNLGYLLQAMGDLTEAQPFYERALAIRKRTLSSAHPDTASSLNNLGGLLHSLGDLAGARPYYERAIHSRTGVWLRPSPYC